MRATVILSALVAILVCGCSNAQSISEKHPLAERIGKRCRVQFRRGDGLGSGANLPVSPTTGEINGAEVSVIGQLRAVSSDWIALESDKREYYIPRASILLVQFDK
jgi:hypothetical protein